MTNQSLELQVLELLELALAQDSAARLAFVEAADEYAQPVRTRVSDILARETDAALLRTGGADAFSLALAETPSHIGGYRIIREIGRGGMGAVFEAERDQGDFEHRVAIKIISTGRMSDILVARFTEERQILARLTHPQIARLYDGGETQAGLPYLVMELVEGQPLDSWLETAPNEAACFAVLDKILVAVEYAHRNLVIHRDLTPGNVIVTEDGDVKLIDFGISSFPSSTATTLLSGQTATPGYRAPESGSSDGPSTAIDIYALGKLMQRLFQGSDRPELHAIAAKAAAQAPEGRYGAVSQLAEDIERYKTDYPVAAYAGGKRYKSGKYIRRNWPALAVAASIALILAGSVSLLGNAYQKEQSARQLAASRFDAVRDLAAFQLFDLYDAMDAIPNTVAARQLVARNSITYLNNLAITTDAPADLRREAGEGWLRLSQVTGGSSGDNIGLPEGALSFGNRALEVLEALYDDYPDDAQTRLALGDALGTLALDSLYIDGDSDTGYRRAARAVDLLAGSAPESARAAVATGRAYKALGDAYGWKNELPKAGEVYAGGLDYINALPDAYKSVPGVISAKSGLMRQLAEVYRFTGRPDEALIQMEKTADFAEARLAQADANDQPSARRGLGIVLWNIADMHRSLGQWAEGLRYAQRASSIIEASIAENPNDIGWLELRSQIETVIAPLISGQGAHEDAVASADRAIATLRAIRETSGANVGTDLALAVGWKDVANVYRRAGQRETACAGLQEAYDIFTGYGATGDLSDYDRENNLGPVAKALDNC